MMINRLWHTAVLVICLVTPAISYADSTQFLQKYCFDCHSGQEPAAGLTFSGRVVDAADADGFRRWVRAFDRVQSGEMPPRDSTQPTADERTQFLEVFRAQLLDAEQQQQAAEGTPQLRRLTRFEYENTIRDLFNMPGLAVAGLLPADGAVNGFDKHVDALDVSHVNVAKYLEAADHVLNYAIATRPHPPSVQTRRISLVNRGGFVAHVVLNGDGVLLKDGQIDPQFPPAAEQSHLSEGAHEQWGSFETGSSVGLFRHEDESFSPYFIEHVTIYPGVYRVKTSLWSFQWDRGQVLPGRGTEAGRLSVVQLTGDGRGGQHPGYVLGYFDAPATGPLQHAVHVWLNSNEILGFNTASLAPAANYYKKQRAMEFTGPGIVVDWLEIEGPLHAVWPPDSHRVIFGDLPLTEFHSEQTPNVRAPSRFRPRQLGAGRNRPDPEPGLWTVSSDATLADAERLLSGLLPRLFRRPVTEAVRQGYLKIVADRLQAGDCFESAMRVACRTALCAPDFLYHVEPAAEVDAWALACRLSYFLWNSLPDEHLAALAASGTLLQPDVLHQEVERLLTDARSQRFVDDFTGQWLKLRQIAANDPDQKLYPEFSPYLQDCMLAETRDFFRTLLQRDLDTTSLVRSDFLMINEKLAAHYGIDGVTGTQIRPVPLPDGCPRGGVLTQASILRITANGTTTSPVPRGAFVLDRLLGQPPEPPPANVAAIEPDVRGATTIREQLQKHRNQPVCASCHARIDPPGFALEAFDVIGGYRERYRSIGDGEPADRGRIDPLIGIGFRLGPAVDASGITVDGHAFRDIRDFQNWLTQNQELLLRNLTNRLLTYAVGRDLRFSDREAVDAIVRRTQHEGGGIRTLIHEVVGSPLFTGAKTTMARPADIGRPVIAQADQGRMLMNPDLPAVAPIIWNPPPQPEPQTRPIQISEQHTLTVQVTGLFMRDRVDAFRALLQQVPEVRLLELDFETAQARLAYDPECDLFRGVQPTQLIERCHNRLQQLSRSTLGMRAVSSVPREQWKKLDLQIAGLDCMACSYAAYDALIRIEGVEQATASFRDGKATAWYNAAVTNQELIVMTLKQRQVVVTGME